MSHVIWHCNGVGPVTGYDPLEIPHYEFGISTYAWAPPDDMSDAECMQIDEKLEKLRQKQLEIIAKATGGEITGDPSMNETYD